MSRTRGSIDSFVARVSQLRFDNAFNPYSDSCPVYDRADAPEIRRANLRLWLEAARRGGVTSVWVARDFGYRGGRRTGLALTDEASLASCASLLGVAGFSRATNGEAVSERTATTIWRTLQNLGQRVFLWNVVPVHPHEPGKPMSNRCHTAAERHACAGLLRWVVEELDPKVVVALGRDASGALSDMELRHSPVRHPSYGGVSDFIAGIERIYS